MGQVMILATTDPPKAERCMPMEDYAVWAMIRQMGRSGGNDCLKLAMPLTYIHHLDVIHSSRRHA